MLYSANVSLNILMQIEAPDNDDDAAAHLARRQACARPGVLPEHIVSVTVAPLSFEEQLNVDNRKTWQESQAVYERGSGTLQRRWLCGMLGEEELRAVAREELFAPFVACTKRRPMSPADIHGLTMACELPSVTWTTNTRPTLTGIQWRQLDAIREGAAAVRAHAWMRLAGPDAVQLEIREHSGTCRRCQRTRRQTAVLVTIRWAGRDLSREYLL